MGSDSGSTSHDGRDDEDDDEEYEEAGEGSRLLGFMFGNVDNSGDLDVDYLDEDAKEHLGALADKLGPSLTDLDLSVKTPQTHTDAAEQDYDRKAEDAVDYEDIDEEYDGPEIQVATEEDFLLPRKDYFSTEVPISTLGNTASIFDDDNYDEDDELEEKREVQENNAEVLSILSEGSPGKDLHNEDMEVISQGEKLEDDSSSGDAFEDALGSESLDADMVDPEEEQGSLEEASMDKNTTPLPILCIDDGMVILRFSEIFGIYEPLKKAQKRERRYPVPREMYKSMNNAELVEEDEEAFLKGSFQGVSVIKRSQVIPEKRLGRFNGDDFDSEKFGVIHGAGNFDLEDEQRKDSCRSSEPFKDDLAVILPTKSNESSCPNFYPLDQLNWEDRIIWDDSPVSFNNIAENCQMSGPDAGVRDYIKGDLEVVPYTSVPDAEVEFHNRPISLEPFSSVKPYEPSKLSTSERFYHPQLLRLETRFDPDISNNMNEKKDGGGAEETFHNDFLRRFDKLTLQNRDLLEGSWLDNIIWEPQQCISKTKLIFDLRDEQMLFEILDNKDGKHLRLHAGAMIVTHSIKANTGDSLELHGHGALSGGRFNISNDKFYSNRKSSQQLKSHMKKRTAHGLKVLHSIPALKLQTMKAKLSNKDIANFHRPRSVWYPHDNEVVLKEREKLPKQGPMKVILKSLGGKGCKLHVDAEEIVSSVKAKASKKLDFKLSEPVKIFYSGKELEDQKSLAAENVRPNSLLHLVRTKIYLLPRAQKLPGENKSLRPPGAFKKKSDLSVKDGHVFLMEYYEERPLLLGNVGMGARLCTYYQKLGPGDQKGSSMRNENSGVGSVIVLDPADKSPFLGDIKPGSSQSSLETNMYRAPIHQHKVSTTDYLLVRSAKGKLSIRRIDRIDVVGQQEPHMEVMSPGSKGVQAYIMNRLLVYLYREFRAVEKRGVRPSIRADELSAQFPSLSEAFLRKRLKHCADLQRGSHGQLVWMMRRNFRIPLEEELRRMVTAENVCAYESMLAGLYRLKRLGITRLIQPTGLLAAMNQLPDEAISLAAASHIERELQITPWNLSSNFVACTNQDRENIERLEITGVGDPSGRGLGFSFVRNTPKPPVSNAVVKKKAVVGKGSTVTGTDADLRRLSMEAAREVLLKFNVPEEQIAKQTRWHRIAMIRKLSSEQAASGVKVDPTTISKYARGQRMSFTQLQQQTREKCQEIWERQVQSLSALDGEENESDSEANSDLDSFAGDLENLLDAEECDDTEDGSHASKHESADGVKGLKMRRRPFQAQAEEKIEDEAAEAAELCRMLMDDEEANRKKKKKIRTVGDQVGRTPVSQSKIGSVTVDRIKRAGLVDKKSMQPDGQSLSKENFTRDQKEDESFSAKRNFPGKVKPKKKNDVEEMELLKKKVKILGDGIKMVKEKKSARESFVCGACGQLGHMRTNKNCPKYGEDPEARNENNEPEKASGKPNSSDQAEASQQKTVPKKVIQKTATKIAVVDALEDDKSSLKGKFLKVKCGRNDKPSDRLTPATSQNSDKPTTSDAETVNRSVVKVNKIIWKTEDVQVESHKPSIVIRPPMETQKDQPRKKIIIKRPKEINVDEVSQEDSTGTEYRKTKKIIELSSLEEHSAMESRNFTDLGSSRKRKEEKRWFEEQEKRRIAEIQSEERTQRLLYEEQTRALEEQERLAELTRYQEDIRREREEEERQKAKKKKKKNRPEIRDDYLDDLSPRRNDRRIPERITKRRAAPEMGRHSAAYAPPTKRRRGGEVGLSNILESIVETLKERVEISYLFLKPVSKKEAPDYLKIIKRPMDLSTIKEKVRKLEYKSREEFRHDVWQITYNAHKYNDGRNPGIPPLADQLLELCDFLLDQNSDSLAEVEAGIESGDS